MDKLTIDIAKISQELRVRPEVLTRIMASFAKNLEDKMVQLNIALQKMDVEMMRAILHEIKGTAGNLRLHNVCTAENAMHVAVKAGDPQLKLAIYFEDLKTESKRFQKFIEDIKVS